jgi:hypothetical protein
MINEVNNSSTNGEYRTKPQKTRIQRIGNKIVDIVTHHGKGVSVAVAGAAVTTGLLVGTPSTPPTPKTPVEHSTAYLNGDKKVDEVVSFDGNAEQLVDKVNHVANIELLGQAGIDAENYVNDEGKIREPESTLMVGQSVEVPILTPEQIQNGGDNIPHPSGQ